VEQEWAALTGVMQITEDYHGYYEDAMEAEVHQMVDDMLSEANPRPFLPREIAATDVIQPGDNPVTLLNRVR